MSIEGVTLDRFMGGRVIAAQPSIGFRAGHDTVLLAAAVPAESGSIALELGSGAGIASLCLAARVPGLRILGIEIDPELVRLANDNAVRNTIADRVSFVLGDAATLSTAPMLQPTSPLRGGRTAVAHRRESGSGGGLSLEGAVVDHIFFNPPFHPDSAHSSPVASRDRATRDSSDAVRTWTGRALSLVRDGGTVTAIIRADRVEDILSVARDHSGVVLPLFPRIGIDPKRAIVRIIKSALLGLPSPLEGEGGAKRRKGGDAQESPRFVTGAGLVLHESDGRNTEAAEAVLRHAKPLNLSP